MWLIHDLIVRLELLLLAKYFTYRDVGINIRTNAVRHDYCIDGDRWNKNRVLPLYILSVRKKVSNTWCYFQGKARRASLLVPDEDVEDVEHGLSRQ